MNMLKTTLTHIDQGLHYVGLCLVHRALEINVFRNFILSGDFDFKKLRLLYENLTPSLQAY